VEACGTTLYISDHFVDFSMNIWVANLELNIERGWTAFETPSTPRTFLFFYFIIYSIYLATKFRGCTRPIILHLYPFFCRIFGEYLGRRFEVQNRRTRGGLCSVFQITITPRPLLVSKLFIHVQSLSGYETPCMGRRIPARPSSSNHFFAELPVVIGDERWPWLRLCRAAGGRERVCRRVVDLWRSKAK